MGFAKLQNLKECVKNTRIYDVYSNHSIDENIVYLESRNGNDFTGNIFRIAEELSTGKYGDFKIYAYAKSEIKSKIENLKGNYDLKIHKIITDENKACEILEKAKYIFTDSAIQSKFIKKDGQIMTNTWHGTPLKLMGFDNLSEQHNIGIIQKSLLYSDYLLYPNIYTSKKMLEAYMVDKIYPGKILFNGYPRNEVFFDKNRREEIRKKLDIENKDVFVYMPTFKGEVDNRKDEKQRIEVNRFLEKIDSNLNDNQILFVKFHPYNQSKIDFSGFENIKAFPNNFENYDVLNACDCLITDYSSVFFDFANTKRKIILFNYDEEEYLADRGLYLALEDLPFPKAGTIDELISEMNLDINYDDSEFLDEFCTLSSINSAEDICATVIGGENKCKFEIIENSNRNILIYADGLEDNQSTESLIRSLERADKVNNNIFISFKSWHSNIKENHAETLKRIPDDIQFLPLSYNITPTVKEKMKLNKFLKNTADTEIYNSIKPLFEKSFKKQYGNIKFDLVIDYNTTDPSESLIFANSNSKSVMIITDKSNKDIYNKFDKIYKIDEISLEKLVN